MTSRDVIVVLRQSKWRPIRKQAFPLARLVDVMLALALFVLWLLAMPGCTMDTNGLSTSLRGRIDVDALEVATSGETATHPDAVPTMPDSGGMAGNSGSSPDGGETTIDAGSLADAGSSLDTPPSACAFDPTLSLTPCDRQTALCRTYDTPGHAVYETGCTVEGYVCVAKCPT